MTKLTLEIHDDVVSVIYKIKNINDSGIELEIPEGSVLFDNIINLKLIEKEADKYGMTVSFATRDEIGNSLIQMLDQSSENTNASLDQSEIVEKEESSQEESQDEQTESIKTKSHKDIKLFGFMKAPIFKKIIKPLLILLILGLVIFGVASYMAKKQKAVAQITIETQPLTRSFPVKVKTGSDNNSENKIIRGYTITESLDGSREAETTGEKMIGEKAKGKIKIYNNTEEEKKFKKGTTIVYEEDSKDDLFYVTTEDVTIAGRTLVGPDPVDPANIIYARGSATVEVTASDIGSKYNLEEDKDLSIKSQKDSEFSAVVDSEIKGGKSEKAKAVAEEDKTKLKNELLQELSASAEKELISKAGTAQELIKGSIKTVIIKEIYSAETADVAEKLTLNLSIQVEGLAYLKADLNTMSDTLVEDLVPQGFMLSSTDREIKAEVLGNSANSVLNSSEADLQVTLKTFIVPAIDEEKLKNDLAGKKPADAEKVLGGLGNIDSYNLVVSRVPFFSKVPKDISQIEIVIERK